MEAWRRRPFAPLILFGGPWEDGRVMGHIILVNARYLASAEDQELASKLGHGYGFGIQFRYSGEERLILSDLERSRFAIRTTSGGARGDRPLELCVVWDLVTSLEDRLAARALETRGCGSCLCAAP